MSQPNPTQYYFKKFSPKVKVFTAQGAPIEMEVIDNVGYFVTTDQKLAGGIMKMISDHRGGFEQITLTEFEAARKKKQTSRPLNTRYIEMRQTSGNVTVHIPDQGRHPQVAATPVAVTEPAKPAAAPQNVSPPISPRMGRRL